MSLPSGSKERNTSTRPYEKSVKCVTVVVGTPTEHASKDGWLMKMMKEEFHFWENYTGNLRFISGRHKT